MNPAKTYKIMTEVYMEREAQATKWGEQHHPADYPHEGTVMMAEIASSNADFWKARNDADVKAHGDSGWVGILLEEVFEAIAEIEPGNEAKLRTELIQVAAVCAAWVEDLDRG